MTNADKIAALKSEIAELKAAIKPTPAASSAELEAYRSEMHQLREQNASVIQPWLRRECAGGVTDADAADIVHARHAPAGPSAQGVIPSSQDLTRVSSNAGLIGSNTTGWREATPLRPPEGTRYVDRIVDEFDRRDRAELARKLGKQ